MGNRLALAAFLLSSCAAAAQTPTFRTDTTLVQLPVRVIDGNGAFVRGLTAADFNVAEDGVPQSIAELSLVDLAASAKSAPAAVPAEGVLSTADLERVDGRIYVFLLDDAHVDVMESARARDLIRGFIKDRMMPGDAAAVVIASGAARQDFTHDKQLLLKAADRFTGSRNSDDPQRLQEARARAVVRLITDLVGALGKIRGRHKSLIYVGSRVGCQVSFEATPSFAPSLQDKSESIVLSGDQILCNGELWDAVRAAVQANVSMYAIDPRGMLNRGWVGPSVDGRGGPDAARSRMAAIEESRPSVLDGFYVLSDSTGGFAVTDTGNYRDSLDRIVRESGTYYLLSYVSTNDSADGKYRRTQIMVKRPGVQTFYRAGYLARR